MIDYENIINILMMYRESINQNVFDIAIFTLIFGILDLLIIPKNSRWFTLHTISNAFTTYYSFPDFLLTWIYPMKSVGVMNWRPLNITVTLHFYHMFFFKNLNKIDWIHHIVMMYVGIYMYLFPLGAPINSVIFFINGLPGGIDYFLLALVKHNLISPFTEKSINIYLNNWIRSPGILISTYLAILLSFTNNHTFQIPHILPNFVPGYFIIECFLGLLIPIALYWNAQYFNQRVLLNYSKRLTERSPFLENTVTKDLINCIQEKEPKEPKEDKIKQLAIVKYQVKDIFAKLRAKQEEDDVQEVNKIGNHLTHLVNL